MSKNITTIEKSAIEYLCGLIRDLSSVSEGIDDINLKTNGTFSSVKIDTLLNNLETNCNEYTDRLVANLSRLELKIVTNEADINKSNILYLHKPDGATSYNQYVVIEGSKVLLGTTDISMTDYYTITQADAKFCLLTDYNSLKTAYEAHKNDTDIHVSTTDKAKWDKVDDKVDKTDIVDNLTSTDTDKPLSANQGKALDDKKLNKADITTTIDYSSTDAQVPSAKSIYYNCIEGIEINQTTIDTYGTEILKYPLGIWRISFNALASKFTDLPIKFGGRIEITSISPDANKTPWNAPYCYRVYNFETYNGENYIRKIENRVTAGVITGDTGWQKVCTTSVADVPLKTLKNSSDIKSDAVINYIVKNGICTVSVNTVSSTKMETGNITLTTGLPIPFNTSCWYSICTNSNTTTAPLQNLLLRIDSSGNLIAYKGTNNVNYFGTFSYPVSENIK